LQELAATDTELQFRGMLSGKLVQWRQLGFVRGAVTLAGDQFGLFPLLLPISPTAHDSHDSIGQFEMTTSPLSRMSLQVVVNSFLIAPNAAESARLRFGPRRSRRPCFACVVRVM
jgi:hypothetical protein